MKSGTRASRGFALGVVAMLVITTILMLGLGGFDVAQALGALVSGALGSFDAITSSTLVRATPLILTGLSVAVAFQAGVFNIGAEGQFLMGAASTTALALFLRHWPSALLIPTVLLAGAVAGALWAWIAAELRERFQVLEVISTIMLNFVATYFISYLVRGPLQEPTHIYPQTESIVDAARLPNLYPGTRLHLGFAVACAACILTWWMIRHTAAGFRLRAVGANPHAARSAGCVDVHRVTARAFLLSGAFAGIAGAVEVTGVTFALYENISPGYGYTAIAVALLARLDAIGVIGTGLLFGALEAGASAMQRDAGVPSVVVSVVEAALILALVTIQRVRITGTARA